jgi:hypothetical protein
MSNIERNLSNALGIQSNMIPPPIDIDDEDIVELSADDGHKELIEAQPKELVVVEEESETPDKDEDYRLARKVLRNLIEKGNDAIDEINDLARQNESARGYEVMATLIKTITDTTKELYGLQETSKRLKDTGKDDDPRMKGDHSINVDKAVVFTGSASQLLEKIRGKDEGEDQV